MNGFLEFRFSMGGQPVVIRFADHLIFDQNHQNHSQIESSGEHKEAGESNGKKGGFRIKSTTTTLAGDQGWWGGQCARGGGPGGHDYHHQNNHHLNNHRLNNEVVERRSTKTKNGEEDRLKVKRAPVYLGGAPPGAKHLPHPKLYRTGEFGDFR